MLNIILFLGLLNLCFQYPLLTSLFILCYFAYQKLTPQDITKLKELTMTIISNGTQFTKYLSQKAKELNITLPNLRNNIVTHLEDLDSILDENNLDIDSLGVTLTEEEKQFLLNSPVLQEKVLKTIKETVHQPELVWRTMSLEQMYDELMEDDYQDTFELLGVEVDFNSTFTQKDFRSLKRQLKAAGRSPNGEIENETLQRIGLWTLNHIYCCFTNQKFDTSNLLINY